jgi:tetratricopeptide (TPR) repeat protein
VPAAQIRVSLLTTTADQPIQWASTDIRGRFTFSGVQPGRYLVQVSEKGYRNTRRAVQIPSRGPVSLLVELDPTEVHGASGASVSLRELQIPGNARKEFDRGAREIYKKKRPQGSLCHFRAAIDLYPAYDEAYIQLSGALYALARYDEARQVLQVAIETNPLNTRAFVLLGILYGDEGEIDKAIQVLQRAIRLDDAHTWGAHVVLGNLLLEKNRIEDAYRHACRAHELQPHAPTVQVLLHKVCMRREEYEVALRELEEFLVLHPLDSWAPHVRQGRDRLRQLLQDRTK